MNPQPMYGQGQLVPCSLQTGTRYAWDGTVASTYKQAAYFTPGGGYGQHEIGRKYDPDGVVNETYKSFHFVVHSSDTQFFDRMSQQFKLPGFHDE